MKNAEYWENRFKQLEEAQHKLMQSDFSEIEKQYAQTQQILDGQIALWYQRFADNNKITLAQAKQYVQGNALNELKWNVHEYIQHGKENAVSGNWKKELENASAKFHITKLEALKIQTQQSLETLFAGVQGTVKNGVGNVYKSGYYHTAFELQKGFGVGFDISSIDQSQLEKIISKPWSPDKYNFSERIWGYKNQLISTVHNILSENIRLGSDPQKAIDKLSLAMNASKQNAGRLVMTEGAYFSSLSQHDCYEKLGVEKYEIVATLDDRTSETCISLDGKVYNITEFQAGATAPPFHPRCRTTTAPYLDYDLKLGERAARDGDGKTYYIPEDFTYSEWKKAFVDGDKSKFDLKVIEETEHYSYKKSIGSVDKSSEKGYNKGRGEKVTDDILMIMGAISGALDPYSDEASVHATKFYEAVRHMKTDTKRIASNTGFNEEDIIKIKDFIFIQKHDLGNGEPEYFYPSYEMAQSWQRLIDGKNIQKHDITLLNHEIMESKLMEHGFSQQEAHRLTEKIYNYSKECDEYYAKINKHKEKQ